MPIHHSKKIPHIDDILLTHNVKSSQNTENLFGTTLDRQEGYGSRQSPNGSIANTQKMTIFGLRA